MVKSKGNTNEEGSQVKQICLYV